MKTWRHNLPSPRAIILLLVVALLCLTVFQSHIHVHSVDAHDSYHADQQHHEHLVTASFIDDLHHLDQHNDIGVVDAKPTGLLISKFNVESHAFLLLLLFSGLLLNRINTTGITICRRSNGQRKFRYWYFSPQLRAPPK